MFLPPAKFAAALFISVCLFQYLAAQPVRVTQRARHDSESGSFYIKNYGSNVYKAAPQNWGVIQDQYGNLVVANGDGVLVYNGETWSLIETPTESVIRSIAMRKDGRIFIGALDDFGYIDRTGVKSPSYVSLLGKLPAALQNMGNIWSTHILNNEVYFEAEKGLFSWNEERFKFYPWPTPNSFHKTFVWRNRLYISEPTSGLLLFDDGKFSVAQGGEVFVNKRIYAAMPMSGELILGTKVDGLYKYDGEHVVRFATNANDYFRQMEIYAGVEMPGQQIAIGTKYGGVVVVDGTGAIRALIRKGDGIASDGIRGMVVDKRNDLWLATEEGISHVEVASDFSLYDERIGLETAVNDICRFEGRIYVACTDGITHQLKL